MSYSKTPSEISRYLWVSLACGACSFAFITLHWGHLQWAQSTMSMMGACCVGLGCAAVGTAAAAFVSGLKTSNARRLGIVAIILGLCGTSGASALMPKASTPPRIRCASCLRQIHTAVMIYANQVGGGNIPRTFWRQDLQDLKIPLSHDADHFLCPVTNELRHIEFLPTQPVEKERVLFFEMRPAEGGANAAFSDGTLRWLSAAELSRRLGRPALDGNGR